MLLNHLYRLSLEEPSLWCMFFGVGGDTVSMEEGLSIVRLHAYVLGFKNAERESGIADLEANDFFSWLVAHGNFPGQGWHGKLLADADGRNGVAIQRFFGLVHEFLLVQRPRWFLDFNRVPQPSQIRNGFGKPRREDVRLSSHVAACTS